MPTTMSSPISPRLLAGFASLVALIVVLGVMALGIMGGLSDRSDRLNDHEVPQLATSAEAESATAEYRGLQLAHLVAGDAADRDPIRDEMRDAERSVDEALSLLVEQSAADEREDARELVRDWRAYVAESAPAIDAADGAAATAAARALLDGAPAETFERLHHGLHAFHTAEQADVDAGAAAGRKAYDGARRTFVAAVAVGVLLAALIGAWLLVIRPLRRAGAAESFRRRFQDALEMADTEDEALDAVRRSLDVACPGVSAELLLADSSQAHLHRAVVAGPDPSGPGCQVDAPSSCSAVRRGRPTVFASSEDLGACPKLRGRAGGACSAVCTPVSVLGRTIGVLHATGPDGSPPAGSRHDALVAAGAQVGSRLGVIRAMTQSQLQASTDPLTGLLNRRSLEDRVRDLKRTRVPFTVGMADLDHFKRLNDTHGHETGDRALRLFAATLSDAVRVQDIVARHGGEEFVVIFPRCSTAEAGAVIERVRAALGDALGDGGAPEFTFSAGLAEAAPDEDFHDALRAADEALMSAKRAGRDRTLIASSIRAAAP